MRIVLLFLFIATLRAQEEKMIDLGSGQIDSQIKGIEYMKRVRESLATKISKFEDQFVEKTIAEIEARHKEIINQKLLTELKNDK
jgi:uncharacterized protein YceH (UPF0502 family)